MGCDIHTFLEVKKDGNWEYITDKTFDRKDFLDKPSCEPFDWRSYGMFGFLNGTRNYSDIEPIARNRGWPFDMSSPLHEKIKDDILDYHSYSYVTLAELLAVDYDKVIWDRRYTKQEGNFFNGAATATDEETHLGTRKTLREFLGEMFFKDLEVLKTLGNPEHVRILFAFDN